MGKSPDSFNIGQILFDQVWESRKEVYSSQEKKNTIKNRKKIDFISVLFCRESGDQASLWLCELCGCFIKAPTSAKLSPSYLLIQLLSFIMPTMVSSLWLHLTPSKPPPSQSEDRISDKKVSSRGLQFLIA